MLQKPPTTASCRRGKLSDIEFSIKILQQLTLTAVHTRRNVSVPKLELQKIHSSCSKICFLVEIFVPNLWVAKHVLVFIVSSTILLSNVAVPMLCILGYVQRQISTKFSYLRRTSWSRATARQTYTSKRDMAALKM